MHLRLLALALWTADKKSVIEAIRRIRPRAGTAL
jgi:hypothetical protein